MKQKIQTMLDMQDAMNTRINENWREAGNAWYRAIWIECGEMLDHYGWKWWKHQEPDMEQVILEIVDIWHFILSDQLQNNNDVEQITDDLVKAAEQSVVGGNIPQAIEEQALLTLQNKASDVASFFALMKTVDLSLDQLYTGYIGKNVLNFFRQDHGYKEGTYQKLWDGREDNEVLIDVISTLDSNKSSFRDDLYAGLKKAYVAATA